MAKEFSLDNVFVGQDSEEFLDSLSLDDEPKAFEDGNDNDSDTTEVDTDELVDQLESVGGNDDKQEGKDAAADKAVNSPKSSNLYSSFANALAVDGILTDIEEQELKNCKTAEDFAELIEKQVDKRFDERQRKLEAALNNGVTPDELQFFENTLSNLDSITDEILTAESDQAENLRKSLIYQDYINRGYSKDRAIKMTEKSVSNGSDIEDAKDALEANKEFYQNKYDQLISDRKEQVANIERQRSEEAEQLKKSILESDKVFGDVTIDKNTRQKVYDNIAKPQYKDGNGNKLTALQKYQMDHPQDFLKNVGLLYTLTNGFTDLTPLIGKQVKKERRKGLEELQHTLTSTGGNFGGPLSLASGVSTDPESFNGWKLDI